LYEAIIIFKTKILSAVGILYLLFFAHQRKVNKDLRT
jgi:hypothetical protein